MKYSELADVYERLEATTKKLKKAEIVAELLEKTPSDLLPKVVLLLNGKVFPQWSDKILGVANQLMIKAIIKTTGQPADKVNKKIREAGDLGLVARDLAEQKKQTSLLKKTLSIDNVFENLQKIPEQEGKNSQERKLDLIAELLMYASPKEACYIVRTILDQLRVGVAEGILRDSIVRAFLLKKGLEGNDLIQERKKLGEIVENAWFLNQDYGEVAETAKESGVNGLKNIKIKLGNPYQVSLGEKVPDIETGMKKFENTIVEFKYDGARICVHKNGNNVALFTRRLENVTKAFPDIVEICKKGLKADKCIVEGECIAVDPKTGRAQPFQKLSQRIKRKYDIKETIKEIPALLKLFDIVYLNGKSLFDEKFSKRRELLEKIIEINKGKLELTEFLVTKDIKEADEFYKRALADGQEGIMIKNLDATYQSGRRVSGGLLKVKPIMETLDLAIIGGTWGTGKRVGWIGSFTLGCRDPETGKFLECGMLGTGVKEKDAEVTLESLTKLLRPLIEKEEGNNVRFKPKIIIEVAYEEIQKSPTYNSGWALRFPRAVRLRFDKKIDEVDSMKRIKELYGQQKGKI